MFVKNGRRLKQPQTSKLERLSNVAKIGLTKLLYWQPSVRVSFLLILFALVLLFAGCATQSSPPSEWPRNPKPPQLQEPLPSESYSNRVQRNIKSWAERLTAIPPM